jgi:hypothetical protein
MELAGIIVEWEKQRQAKAKAATDTRHVQPVNTERSTLAAGGDFTAGAIHAKQSSHAAGSSDDLTKRVNTETGLPILGMMFLDRTSTPNIGTLVIALFKSLLPW